MDNKWLKRGWFVNGPHYNRGSTPELVKPNSILLPNILKVRIRSILAAILFGYQMIRTKEKRAIILDYFKYK